MCQEWKACLTEIQKCKYPQTVNMILSVNNCPGIHTFVGKDGFLPTELLLDGYFTLRKPDTVVGHNNPRRTAMSDMLEVECLEQTNTASEKSLKCLAFVTVTQYFSQKTTETTRLLHLGFYFMYVILCCICARLKSRRLQ